MLLTTALALGVSSAPSISAPAPDGPSATGLGATDLLPRPMSGKRALRTLGNDLAAAARVNGRTQDELQALLEHDPAATLDQGGRLHFRDDLSQRSMPAMRAATPAFPLQETFELHSRPGSNRVIYLDFDGGTVSGTAWNDGYGVKTSPLLGFSLDSDYGSFSSQERAHIQEIWQRVAEDYAPFNVDVTTEEPPATDISRSGSGDQRFGTRALITDDRNPLDRICGGACTGVAYIDVFDTPTDHAYYQPAFAFTADLNDVFNISETISHEVGHNFGLLHDGVHSPDGDNYYEGHGNWAPIMGSGLGPVIQWSDGAYSGAANYENRDDEVPLQDDVAIINSSGAPYRADDAADNVASAGPVPASGALGTGIIETRTDVDVFALGQCVGPVEVSASPAPVSPNLDIKLELLDTTNQVLDSDDPRSSKSDSFTATGMGAQVTVTEGDGRSLFVRIDGVGNGTPDDDYNDYGSIGRYTLDVTCSGGTTADVPGQVTGLSASSSAPTSATVTWSAPSDDGGSSITGYRVSLVGGGSTTVDAGTTSHTFTGLSPDTTYTVQVAAVNGEGDGPASSTTVTTQADEVVEPTDPLAGPKIKKGFYNRKGTKLTLKWKPVDDAAGYIVVFTNRRGKVMDFFDQGQRTKGRIAMRKVSRKARFVQMVAYDLDGNIGDYGKRWRL
ncbi:MAG: fibronectin type III domain-containing protein [Nocardioides sp.]|nr:fibronectin type III domain-containing protein [Nocardioides sp.]